MLRKPTLVACALAALAFPAGAIAKDSESQRRISIDPYIEVDQTVIADLSPDNDVVTYTSAVAGIDASFKGRNNAGGISIRYEHRFGEGSNAPDGDVVSGIARVSAAIVPQTLTIEAGGLAAQTRVEGNGSAFLNPVVGTTGKSNIYAAYAVIPPQAAMWLSLISTPS